MRQIDNMTRQEIETLHLKGMLAEPTTMTREQKLGDVDWHQAGIGTARWIRGDNRTNQFGLIMSAFHRWLLKHRPFCEICYGPYPSTRIIDIQGHAKAVCDAHFQSHHPLRAGYERKVAIHYSSKNQER